MTTTAQQSAGQGLRLITPAARPTRPVPWPAVFGLNLAVVATVVLQNSDAAWTWWLVLSLKAVAMLCACFLGAWGEDRIYTALAGRAPWFRILSSLVLPPLALTVGLGGAVMVHRTMAPLQDAGVGGLTVFAAFFWMASAAVGSFVVLVLDYLITSLVEGLRARIGLAVLSLLITVAFLALALYQVLPSLADRLALQGPSSLALQIPSLFLSGARLTELMAWVRAHWTVSIFALELLAVIPAVLSASAKLAEAVMERLHPLAVAFEAVADGNLAVRVEEEGSRELVHLARSFNGMVRSLFDAQITERAFGLYVSPHVVNRIRGRHGEITIPASLREASVFFADIRGFTAMAETFEPSQVLEILNRYFAGIVPVVDRFEGYLDKFIGDAMIVVFNGPIDQPDHAERAVRCAIALQSELAFLKSRDQFPEAPELAVGIGIATGPMVTGSLGTARKMEYTVIGDTVNLASRLTNHAGPGEIWMNQACAEALPPDLPRTAIGPLKVKGKVHPVQAYRAIHSADLESTEKHPTLSGGR